MADHLPFHADFQDTVAAYLWRKPSALQKWHATVKSGYFETPTTSHVVGLLLHHFETYKRSPNEDSLRELIRKSFPKANDPIQVQQRTRMEEKVNALKEISLADEKFLEDQLQRFAGDRAVRAFVLEVIGDIESGNPIDELVDKAKTAAMAGQTRLDIGQNWRDETYRRTHEYIDPESNPRVSTGLHHLDLEMGGGPQGGELCVLLAPPKGFKSATLLNFALSALQVIDDKNVLYVTLELSEDLVGVRADWRTTMMTKPQMFQDIDRFYDVLTARQEALYGDNKLFIKYLPPKKCTASMIQQLIQTLQEEHGIKIGMVIVDYLNLMTNDGRRIEKEYLELVAATTELRAVATEESLPIWTAARANREAVGKRRLNIGHIGGAFEIIAIADYVAAICRTDEERLRGQARIVPLATRNDAGNNTIICEIDGARMCITSVDAREVEEIGENEEDQIRETRQQRKRKQERDKELENFDFDAV